ncbi:hypothetical protein D2T29_19825 [Sinirhodobacter populi]|uniref:Uncharacterized protein n=1 Tax=Paenirhodobacter populi TaxID=2306993 RepID=A0A443K232_9RHOB|nr:hypothetical protein [Sinirhodobacter populi]RWR26827.1 hypothetical protein D2T29_19825 [Sinirhodobacter populi]
MTDQIEDPKITMRRIEALGTMAVINANNSGGDNATAAADLMCAFVLMAMHNGADPDRALAAMWEHAKVACDDWWGAERRKVQ